MLTLSRKDLKLRVGDFDLTDTRNVLRIMVGALLIPHALGKFSGFALNAGTVGFFEKAGLHPAAFMTGFAAFSELAVGIALILGICTRFGGFAAAAILALASYALIEVKHVGWLWNFGGIEYNVVWAVLGILVSVDAWKEYAKAARPALRAFRPAHA